MPINVLMVEYMGGWLEVVDTDSVARYGRAEALLGLGYIANKAEAERVATEQLAIYANRRTAITAELLPRGLPDTPYVGFRLGDVLTVPDIDGTPADERVVGISVSQDSDGEMSYALDLKDTVLEEQERFAQALKKMSDGTIGGTSKVAAPLGMAAPRGQVPLGRPIPGGGQFIVNGKVNWPSGRGYSIRSTTNSEPTPRSTGALKINRITATGVPDTAHQNNPYWCAIEVNQANYPEDMWVNQFEVEWLPASQSWTVADDLADLNATFPAGTRVRMNLYGGGTGGDDDTSARIYEATVVVDTPGFSAVVQWEENPSGGPPT